MSAKPEDTAAKPGDTAAGDDATDAAEARDPIDTIEREWRAIRPELEIAPIAIVGRLLRAAALTIRRSDEALAQHGLTRGEFDVLSALRRAGGPQRPSDLTTVSLASAPATTKRLKALTARGLVARAADPDDGRGALIALTPTGAELIDRVFPAQLETERELLAGIPAARRDEVVAALRLLLASVERA
ncbi:MarR family transcriptional regulator [Conexibacter stalactiti]|uniref:MarR family transcriptional regulator n=1 Tax=Conexibacter stalactiti TaxID=1940611 RepID=A0ABU4HXE8_9ACTN|nr:MarR family transcriptional regulator [Conexibacter stalactiti]MDW5597898.1 MarR family transcriptional regulator [Conexibacter stalactiti]MEC5038540.1 MarR family transcriptional regulator [Conexibacter stalactiti]